jgi:hypothetical protein
VLPPSCRTTHLWLLYQYVGLTPSTREAARARWLGYFPEANHEQVIELGEKIADQRREAGEALPDAPEVVPGLCVVERLTGSDLYGRKCRDILDAALDAKEYTATRSAIHAAYPNDDYYYLTATRDPFGFGPGDIEASSLWRKCLRETELMVLLGFSSLGLMTVLDWAAAPLLMRTARAKRLWKEHRAGRGREPVWAKLAGVSLTALIGATTAKLTLPELVVIQIGGYEELFLGAFTMTFAGGILIAACRRLIAIVFTAVGINVEKTWLDELLGIAAGTFLLLHFGSDALSIGLAIASDLLATGLEWLGRRKSEPA